MVILFAVTMLLAALALRAQIMGERGGVDIDETRSGSRALLATIAVIAGWSVIVWGFLSIQWYFVLLSLILSAFVAGVLVNKATWFLVGTAELALDLVLLLITVGLWVSYLTS